MEIRKSKCMENQLFGILVEGEAGFLVAWVCRKIWISNSLSYYQWKSKYSGVSVSGLMGVGKPPLFCGSKKSS